MITCALWDIESRELDRRQRGPKARVAYLIRAWSPHSKDGHITQAIRTPPQLTSAEPSETFYSLCIKSQSLRSYSYKTSQP